MTMRDRIKRLLAVPVFEEEEKARTTRLLNVVLLSLLVTLVLLLVIIPLLGGLPLSEQGLFTWLATLLVLGGVLWLLLLTRRGQVHIVSVLLSAVIWLITTTWVCGFAGIASDSSVVQYALLIMLSGLLLGGRAALLFTLFSLLAIGGAYYAETSGWLVPEHEKAGIMDLVFSATPVFLIGLLLRYAVNSLFDALRRARENERAQAEANRELQAIRATLEQRVADRTRDLGQRAILLQAANAVGRAATSILDTEVLLSQITELIRVQFDLGEVGFFLLDETGEWVVLRAAAGEVASALLARQYRVRVGEGLVGQSVAQGQLQVAGMTDEAPRRPAIHEWPGVRAEAVLPLRSRGRVLGALTLASRHLDAFDAATLTVFETVADQVAVALDNTRLFAESQAALEAARRVYGELSQQAWLDLLRPRAGRGYRYAYQTVMPLAGDWPPEMAQAAQTGQRVWGASTGESTVAIPIKVRDEVVGVLGFYKDTADEPWTGEELALLETLADQLGIALESARLYQDTQRRAVQERLIGEITGRMRETLDLDTVLQAAVREIGQALDLHDVTIRLGVMDTQVTEAR